jgi:hypothetical protein
MFSRLDNALRFLGYGDPESAKLWFVGIEEARPFETIEELDRVVEHPFKICAGYEGSPTRVYAIISQIVTGLFGKDWKNQWKDYREQILFSRGSEVVQANLYPLGKPRRSSWPVIYTEIGLSHKEYYEWIAGAESKRFLLLRKTRSNHDNPLTICFGTSVWSDFIKCFALDESPFDDYQHVRFYPKERIILTPFFWTGGKKGITHVRVQQLIDLINKIEMNPYKESNQQASGRLQA